MVSLKKPTPRHEDVQEAAAEKPAYAQMKSANVQMNILVSPAFRMAIKRQALDEGVHVNDLITRVMTEYMQTNSQ